MSKFDPRSVKTKICICSIVNKTRETEAHDLYSLTKRIIMWVFSIDKTANY